MAIKRICNKCGEVIKDYNDFSINYQYSHASHHDGDYLNLDLCGKCLDELTEHLIDTCKINPVEGTTY
jgi:hypothetical protein